MARVTIEDCLKNVDSRFSLVHLAVRRVLQLREGSPPFVNAPKNREVVVALREIASGKVRVDNIRQLEETRSIVPPAHTPVAEAIVRQEVEEEIMEAAAQFDSSIELEEQAGFSTSNEVDKDTD